MVILLIIHLNPKTPDLDFVFQNFDGVSLC